MKKAQVLWLIFGAVALLFLIGAATVQPGRPISQYPRVTILQGADIFPIARTNVTPATNMGVTGFIISNYVVSIATGAVEIVAGTNVIITSTTNSTGGQTHTIAVTNTGSGVADGVWTNNAGVIHPKVSNGQQTNSIQIYTNGAMAIGLGTLPYWGVPVAGETLVSLRDTGVGDLPWNETFVGVRTGANLFWQNNFVEPSVNRRTYAMEHLGLRIDEYMTSDSNFVYRAFNTNGLDIWHFTPSGAGASNDTRYTFNSTGPVDASDPILAIQNSTTNKLTVYGGAGNVDVVGQITNQFLTASKFVKTDANKGLVSSTLDEAGITNLITELATNNVKVTAGTNIVVITNVSGNVVTYNINGATGGSGIATNDGTGWRTTFLMQTNHNFIQWTNLARLEPETNMFSLGTGILALRNGVTPQEFWINQSYAGTNNQTGIRFWGSGTDMNIQAMSRPSAGASLTLGAGETGDSSSNIRFQIVDVTKAELDPNGAFKPGADNGGDLGTITDPKRWNNGYFGASVQVQNTAGFIQAPRVNATTIADVGGLATDHITVATNYTASTNISVILVDTSPSNITVTLPSAGVLDGHHYWIKNISTGQAIVAPGGSTVIDLAAASYTLTNQYQSLHLTKQSTNWWIMGTFR